jgi:hypothetical protein
MGCKDSSAYILDQTMCLYDISKETPVEPPQPGDLRQVLLEEERCDERDCRTLKTIHQLDLRLTNGPCDSDQSQRHNGRLYSCDLTHALNFKRDGSDGRGFHGGTFTWADQGFLASGTLSGVTNAGTHRPPVGRPDCQDCDAPGFMEGRFCGVIRRSADPALLGCQVFGAYRLRLEGSLRESTAKVWGVLEGVIVCECAPTAQASAS